MNTGEAEPSSGLNGRLRPRKSNKPSPKTANSARKADIKPVLDKPRRTSSPSKAPPNKSDDLTDKADSPAPQTLCPYCDKTFFTEQSLSRHVRRLHLPNSQQDITITCLFCTHIETDANEIIRHMVDNHPNQYFACYDCHTRFPSTTELAEHKLTVCEKQNLPYRNKLRQKVSPKKNNGRKDNDVTDFPDEHGFNGIVISCELKSSHAHELGDIEDNITTNFILPPGRNLVNGTVIEKNAVIILDDLQWNKRVPTNFSFQSTEADQILSRLGVVHRSPRTGESQGKEWLRIIDESHQKFEKCFDTSFYSKVASNVQENLSKFLDGSCNFNPDAENTIKTRKTKNIVAINTVEGFPILLACEQFSRNGFDGYMPRAIAPKHKWKWDSLENDKNIMSPERIKRDSHTNNCIISLVSSLDIWTQLCMRRKFESIFHKSPVQKKTERKSIIGKELKEILESRELPVSTAQIVKYTNPPALSRSSAEFPVSLGLVPTAPSFDLKPAVLSGEWVRPRCYVCCACGAQSRDSKALSSHISMRHPNAQIQHYEIVGEVLLNSDILKHLYVPPSQINNRTRPPRGFKDCTKCNKSVSLEDLHQHMLDCAGDTPAVRRKCRYRPFGVRKRRPRLSDNMLRKKIRKDLRTRHTRKTHMRPRPRRRTEVGDAETIRKMLADLPAKRHRVVVKPVNPTMRPRRNLQNQRNKIVLKKRLIEETKKSQEPNSTQGCTSSEDVEDSKKISHDCSFRPPVRTFKSTVKRVTSKILRKKDSFNKNILNKTRKRIGTQKDKSIYVASAMEMPLAHSGKDGVQVEQLSVQNNSGRINLNNGSSNSRERGNRSNNNNSNNRDRQSPEGQNDQGNNPLDGFAPPQNVPLKHSIASLTANCETHDKAVQFHHSFLIQQECNEVNQHLPAGPRMLFENEAVVTKLDKPPLHYSHRRPIDLQALPKNKQSTKPRKGLNDCIAMLKNKLVEPISSPPGFVSVQCGDDEPLAPEPIIVERRHSTNELNTNYAQIPEYVSSHTPKKDDAAEMNVQITSHRAPNKSRTTRRSASTRYGHSPRNNKPAEIIPNDNMLTWGQFYYDTQMLATINTQNITENYNKRVSRRRNSLVTTDELMLQHAMNLELLAKSTELTKLAEYHHYPGLSTNYQLPKKNVRKYSQKQKTTTNTQPPKSRTKNNTTTRAKNIAEPGSTTAKQSNRNKSNTTYAPTKKNSEKRQRKSSQLNNTVTAMDQNIDFYPQGNVIEDTSARLNMKNTVTALNKSTQEHHFQNISRNAPVVEYTANNDMSAVQYIISNPVEADNSGPLDLTNKLLNKNNSEQYTQEQFPIATYDTYETLDLSNKNVDNPSTRSNTSSDEIVDLRVNYAIHDSFQSTYTPMAAELVNNEDEDNATDLSVRRDEDFPTDLSVTRRDSSTPSTSFEKSTDGHNRLPLKYIRDVTHPASHADDRCIIMQEYYDPNSGNIVVFEKEMSADLSGTRSVSRLNMCAMEDPMHLEMYSNNTEPNDDYVPTDLSGRNRPYVVSINNVNNNICHYNNFDTQQASHCIHTDQIIDYHYDHRPRRDPSETSFIRSSNQTSVVCCEPTEHFITNTAIVPVTRGLSLNESSVNKSTSYQQIEYPNSDIPLGLVTNSVIENINYNPSSTPTTTYDCNSVTDNCISVSKSEPIYTSTTINAKANTIAVNKNIESLTEIVDHEIQSNKNTDGMKSISPVDTSVSKKIPVTCTFTSTTTSTVEANSSKIINSEQDHETARKIAMLPKELLEILGTMPVDHRNQLLNVLPQYVSTSTSAASHSNISESSPASLLTIANKTDQVGNEFKFEANCEDGGQSNALTLSSKKFSESSTVPVSSSILLTPPTPQMSERYSHQTQENTDIQMYMGKSRLSVEEKAPSTCGDINTLNADANTLTVKQIHTIDYNEPLRVIDLTNDKNSSGNSDMTNTGNIMVEDVSATTFVAKPLVQKASNDKTASLRAVRIKTPSERHRSFLAENKLIEKQHEILSINIQDEPTKDPDDISPKAIQQDEISSTQHRSVLKTASHTPTTSLTEKSISENKIKLMKDDNNAIVYLDKSNLVTSTLANETNSNINNDCSVVVYENSKTAAEIKNSNLNISDNINNKQNVTKENVVTKKQTSFEIAKNTSLIEDDDSEDDVSLAVIVQQKHRNSNFNNDSYPVTNIDAKNKQKKKICKKNKKSSLDDKREFNKITHTEEIVSQISLSSKDRESKIVNAKKKAKKGKRIINAQIANSNNVSLDTVKGMESLDEPTNLKDIEQDPHLSSFISATYTNNAKDVNNKESPNVVKNDENNKNIEINEEYDLILEAPINMDDTQLDTEYNLSRNFLNSSCTKHSRSQPCTSTEHEISAGSPENTKEIILQYSSCDKLEKLNKSEQSQDLGKDKFAKNKKVTIDLCPAASVSYDSNADSVIKTPSEFEESNITPLRRSRRGKSLFIDSNSAMSVNPVLRDSEQRTPLTKKQLIFSKLLLDEAKHNKISLNQAPLLVNDTTNSLNSVPNIHEDDINKTSMMVAIANKADDSDPNICEVNEISNTLNSNANIAEKKSDYISFNSDQANTKVNRPCESPSHTLEENHDKVFLNTISNITEEPSHIPIIIEDVSRKSNNIQKEENEDLESHITTSSECIGTVHEETIHELLNNKRKISRQTKRKSKKKKSSGNQFTSETNDESVPQKDIKNKGIESNNESELNLLLDDTVPEISSINDDQLIKQDVSDTNTEGLSTHISLDSLNTSPKHLIIEKRKSSSPSRQSILPNSKPKKSKLSDENENTSLIVASNSKDIEKSKTDESKIVPRNTTCYNKPARRARSKSVVEKSSNTEFYDPYDIDLEDMADKAEPFSIKKISAKMSFSSFKSFTARTRKLSKTTPSAIIDISPTEPSEPVPSTSACKDGPVHDNAKIDCHSDSKFDCNRTVLHIKDGSSDSDESTKSDVPLKKYAEKKEKKLAELSVSRSKISDDSSDSDENLLSKSKSRKNVERSKSINKKEENAASDKIDSEKERRSEQFMESFGFFSERKPRKSNLLATKKISETFHIIANDNDDVYFASKEQGSKKATSDCKKEDKKHTKGSSCSASKRAAKGVRKKKSFTSIEARFCTVCKKSFRRSDNFLRHQMSLYHVSRLCEVELKVKSVIIEEEPNYLIAYRQQLEKLKFLQEKIAKRKKNSLPTSDIILPTLQEIIADVKRTIREQKLSRRKLSRDEALFLDCCEMLKQSHKNDIIPENKRIRPCNNFNCPQTCEDQLALENCHQDCKFVIKSDEDMDSITAKKILESDEVRNLENDLISNLKEASGLKGFANLRIKSSDELTENVSEATAAAPNQKDIHFEELDVSITSKPIRQSEVKDKIYPNIYDTIDMFEDKFDKIKRKCRSQAAAAKQIQIQAETNLSNKPRKKSDRKKVKRSSKKCQNVVPTKGALKGFDGIKVSILTSDINMSAIIPSLGSSFKKKKKSNTKKKRERKSSDVSKSDGDHANEEPPEKKVDVYEFLDTDTELFEIRPSTLLERFKNYNKELPSTSKANANEHTSTESTSDGDDFVYLDDLAFSEDETENSILSCELSCSKGNNETKKSMKRKDVIEKNAVMGKIFKHNAVRSDKKITKEDAKPEANLDQLFDSLLEKKPEEQSKDVIKTDTTANTHCKLTSPKKDTAPQKHNDLPPVILSRKPEPSMSVTPFEELISQRNTAASKYEPSKDYSHSPQVLKFDTPFSKYRKIEVAEDNDYKMKYHNAIAKEMDISFKKHKSKGKLHAKKTSFTKRKGKEEKGSRPIRREEPEEGAAYEDAGVARQRARRKCTVGKQNVLAETWSSESEPDAAPPRPNSAESVAAPHARRKRPRRREAPRRPVARRPEARASDGEGEPGQPPQHGWIVGDSHKKLVTLLAHAKGRKRSHDDKRRPLD